MAQPALAAIAGFVAAALIAGLGIHVLRGAAVRHGLVDNPGGRKLHCRPTPVVGGIGIAVALLAVGPFVLIQVDADLSRAPVWLAATASLGAFLLLLVAGLIDDQRGIGSTRKFLVQGLAAALLIAGAGLEIEQIGHWPSGAAIEIGVLSVPVTVIAIVGFVNAFNMIDGVDGLAGSIAVVMLAAIVYAGWSINANVPTLLAVVLAGACVGFLTHNLRTPWRARAAAFMGDAGSLIVGLIIVGAAIDVSQREPTSVSAMAVAWVVGLPVIDTLNLMIRRLLRGQSPFHADRNHLHHILGRAGFTPGQTAMIVAGVTLGIAIVGIGGAALGVPDLLLGIALILVAIAHYVFVRYAWRTAKALRRLRHWLAARDPDRLPMADALALVGLYTLAIAIPAGLNGLAGLGIGLLALGSFGQRRAMVKALRHLAITRVSLLMAAWMSLAVFMRPAPEAEIWLPMIALTGVFALPIGWWLARLWHHTVALFALAVGVLMVAWAISADWPMLEAGHVRITDHWGSLQTVGLLLALMLICLVGAVGYGLADYNRRWRARVALYSGMIGVGALLVLLLGLSLRPAIAAGTVGLLAMVVSVLPRVEQSTLRISVVTTVLATLLVGLLMANTLNPQGLSVSDRYWEPVQSALLQVGGATTEAHAKHPGVAARVADWSVVADEARMQPLAGFGRVSVDQQISDSWPANRSAYAALLLVGGVPALALFIALVVTWRLAMARSSRRQVGAMAETTIAHGLMATVLGALLFGPTVDNPLTVMLVTGVFALVVLASLDAQSVEDVLGPPDAATSGDQPTLRIVHGSADRR